MSRNKSNRKEKKLARNERRESRRESRRGDSNVYDMPLTQDSKPVFIRTKVEPKNEEQRRVLTAIENSVITVVSGRVGSGKTFLAATKGVEMLLDPNSKIERLILLRPPEILGKGVGFLPGTKEEKMRPFLEPILGGVEHVVGKVGADRLMAQGKIEFVLLDHLRGRSWDNAFVIVDEANNLSKRATAVATLRVGLNSKLVFCGDERQADIKESGMSLFRELMEEYERVPFMYRELTKTVRSPEASAFASMYEELGIEY